MAERSIDSTSLGLASDTNRVLEVDLGRTHDQGAICTRYAPMCHGAATCGHSSRAGQRRGDRIHWLPAHSTVEGNVTVVRVNHRLDCTACTADLYTTRHANGAAGTVRTSASPGVSRFGRRRCPRPRELCNKPREEHDQPSFARNRRVDWLLSDLRSSNGEPAMQDLKLQVVAQINQEGKTVIWLPGAGALDTSGDFDVNCSTDRATDQCCG